MKPLLAAALLLGTLGLTAGHPIDAQRASGLFLTAPVPYLPGSMIPLQLNGLSAPYQLALLGPGRLSPAGYLVPDDASGSASIIASSAGSLASHTFTFAPAPDSSHDFVAVATYDDGIILHDPHSFAMRSTLAVGGAPGDVAIDVDGGLIGTGATDGDTATIAHVHPWSVTRIEHVPETDEVVFDPKSHALYVTNRDVNGVGAVTRVSPDGSTTQRVLGLTAEGIVIDPVRRRLYVANVNDATVSIVDADSLVELRRFKAIDRAFALALSPDGSRLFVVSNQSVSSPFAQPGSVIAIDVASDVPHTVARSAPLSFPIGVAYDASHRRVYVTDERDDTIDVLDPRTLKALRAPLETCHTPWKPTLDGDRLYVPCARADQVDVLDTKALHRVHGAPFETGGYPLAVAVWHGR